MGGQYHNLIDDSTSTHPNNDPRTPNDNPHLHNSPNIQMPDEMTNPRDVEQSSPHGNSNVSEQPDGEIGIGDVSDNAIPETEPNHVEIPVPDESDSELVCEDCWHLDHDQAWCFEVNICQQDVHKWRREENPHEMAFLVSAAKRQRSEVKLASLTSDQRRQFEDVKAQEIDSWLATETVAKVLRHQIPQENVLRCRWILTWKEVENPSPDLHSETKKAQFKAKARLVVLGYEDPQVDSIPRDSPTMSKLSRMMILQLAASKKWVIGSFDVKTAFLCGQEQGSRILGIEPPIESRQRLKLQARETLRLLKGAYGRVDAPYLWFQELKTALEALQLKAAPFDPCTFVLVDAHGITQGLIGVHVDDGLCCGSEMFHQKLRELAKTFPFGSQKQTEFTFTGLHVEQQPDFSISVDQQQDIKDIQPITLTRTRRMQQEDIVNEKEHQSLRGLVGSLYCMEQWTLVQTYVLVWDGFNVKWTKPK